ncbi:MAG: hypothetical protein ACRD6W_03455 [Nitrososphaerales archaeon]
MDRAPVSLREAVEQHLAAGGFPPDGGINEKWVVVGVGPVPFCFPNTRARRKATPIHDLNHGLSGYGHDLVSEAETGACELGGGCKNYSAAWRLDWAVLVPGLFTAPGRMLKAFARGRRTGNLYGAEIDAVLGEPLDAVRRSLGLDREYPVRVSDIVLFLGHALAAPVAGATPALAAVVTSPLWLSSGAHKRQRSSSIP